MLKIIHTSHYLTLNGVIGIDPDSEGFAMATSHKYCDFIRWIRGLYGNG